MAGRQWEWASEEEARQAGIVFDCEAADDNDIELSVTLTEQQAFVNLRRWEFATPEEEKECGIIFDEA